MTNAEALTSHAYDAPVRSNTPDSAGNLTSFETVGSKSYFSPTFGLGIHEYATRHFRFELNGSGFGIQIERIEPGKPQQNGRHERMHLTLKKAATNPAAANVLQQQARFDDFIAQYNQERPHESLKYRSPNQYAEVNNLPIVPYVPVL